VPDAASCGSARWPTIIELQVLDGASASERYRMTKQLLYALLTVAFLTRCNTPAPVYMAPATG